MSCTTACVKPTPSGAHCAAECHRTFSSAGGFDRHRRDGCCLDPAELGMTESSGTWRMPISEADAARLARISEARSARRREPQSDENGPGVPPATPGDSEAANSRSAGRE